MQPRKEHYRRKMPHFQQPGQWYMVTCILKDAIPRGALDKYSIQLEAARNQMKELENRISRESTIRESEFHNSDRNHSDFGKSESHESESRDTDFPKSVREIFDLGKSKSHLEKAKKEYLIALRKYRLAYENELNTTAFNGINLAKDEHRKLIEETLLYWENKRLSNHAWCIMPNHFHWIFTVFEKEGGVGGVGVSNSNNKGLLDFSSTLESRSPGKSDFPKSDINKTVYLQDILHSVKLFTARRINRNENRIGQLWEHESFETTIRDDRHFENALNYVLNNPVKAGFVQDWKDWPGTRTFPSP